VSSPPLNLRLDSSLRLFKSGALFGAFVRPTDVTDPTVEDSSIWVSRLCAALLRFPLIFPRNRIPPHGLHARTVLVVTALILGHGCEDPKAGKAGCTLDVAIETLTLTMEVSSITQAKMVTVALGSVSAPLTMTRVRLLPRVDRSQADVYIGNQSNSGRPAQRPHCP
jgi:hypothetical protein